MANLLVKRQNEISSARVEITVKEICLSRFIFMRWVENVERLVRYKLCNYN